MKVRVILEFEVAEIGKNGAGTLEAAQVGMKVLTDWLPSRGNGLENDVNRAMLGISEGGTKSWDVRGEIIL